jgi:frataxin-like iron-binding protein CyaY
METLRGIEGILDGNYTNSEQYIINMQKKTSNIWLSQSPLASKHLVLD